jgi:hypothetical protein
MSSYAAPCRTKAAELCDAPNGHMGNGILVPSMRAAVKPIDPFIGRREHAGVQRNRSVPTPYYFLTQLQVNARQPNDWMYQYSVPPSNFVVVKEASIWFEDSSYCVDHIPLVLLVFIFVYLIRVPTGYLPYPSRFTMHSRRRECINGLIERRGCDDAPNRW